MQVKNLGTRFLEEVPLSGTLEYEASFAKNIARSAIYFAFDGGDGMMNDSELRAMDHSLGLNLPFDRIAIEHKNTLVIAEYQDSFVCVQCLTRIERAFEKAMWSVSPIFAIPRFDYIVAGSFDSDGFPRIKTFETSSCEDHLPIESQDGNYFFARVLLSLLNALSCSNIEIVDFAKAPEKLNKKRASKSKPPIFTYKTLAISGGRSKTSHLGGSHSSPRVHLRRGHIRRLPDKNVWVNACVVGDKSKGIVHKDYAVTAR